MTGVGIESLLLVTIGLRHQLSPVSGFKEFTAWLVQTINCRLPPDVMIKGELLDTESSSAFQTSLPVRLSSATIHAPGLPPVKTTKRSPSIKGDPRQLNSRISYFRPNCTCQMT